MRRTREMKKFTVQNFSLQVVQFRNFSPRSDERPRILEENPRS